ncbi:MAG: hypothetical protein ABEJ04_06275 [Halobacteriaceae archaeon]
MDDRVGESALWGAVGALVFLVAALAYRILTDADIGLAPLLGVGVAVGVLAAALAYLAAPRVPNRRV